ncbi:TRAP transporter small permease [Pikeienuella piscinae]|uniref:TRAP transporter small permease protein n=1 Tax=Pikeienuella piscinae TaxID=2748098 RepID=A0A7L5BY01_9RHOB|nr:TRAP transporter small permease [Pikeienuella piscinae]QIE56013.1 TRAP transporter small permease [Pikeienuella piscinae]
MKIEFPKWLLWLDKNFEYYFNVILYSYLTFIIVIEVFRRHVLDNSSSYGEETARYAFIWLAYLAAARGVKKRSHLSIDLIRAFMGRKGNFILFMVNDFLFFVLAVVVIVTGTRFVITTIEYNQYFTGIQIPYWIAVASIPVGWGMIALRVVQRCVLTIQAYRRGEAMEAGFIGGE